MSTFFSRFPNFRHNEPISQCICISRLPCNAKNYFSRILFYVNQMQQNVRSLYSTFVIYQLCKYIRLFKYICTIVDSTYVGSISTLVIVEDTRIVPWKTFAQVLFHQRFYQRSLDEKVNPSQGWCLLPVFQHQSDAYTKIRF